MAHLLYIRTSIFHDEGVSTKLANQFVAAWAAGGRERTVTVRDLAAAPLAHIDEERFNAFRTRPAERTARQSAIVECSDRLIAELRAADIVLVCAPMYNLSIPSTLKAYIDYIVRAGETIRYTPEGAVGLLPGKTAIVVSSRGGVYDPDDEFITRYLSRILNFVGIAEVHFIYADGLDMGAEPRRAGLAAAEEQIIALLSRMDQSACVHDSHDRLAPGAGEMGISKEKVPGAE